VLLDDYGTRINSAPRYIVIAAVHWLADAINASTSRETFVTGFTIRTVVQQRGGCPLCG